MKHLGYLLCTVSRRSYFYLIPISLSTDFNCPEAPILMGIKEENMFDTNMIRLKAVFLYSGLFAVIIILTFFL